MNVVVAGLTAAGKTTHALLLARWLGFDYFSASQLMLEKLGVNRDANNSIWVTRMDQIEERRNQHPVDQDVNDLLLGEVQRRTNTVFDSWSLPWLDKSPSSVKLWINSSPESRALKARVSQEPYGPFLSLADCRRLVDEKDASTARRLEPLLGVDIRQDRSVFDLVLDNTHLIEQPTIEAARLGVAAFHWHLVHAVSERLPVGVAPPQAK